MLHNEETHNLVCHQVPRSRQQDIKVDPKKQDVRVCTIVCSLWRAVVNTVMNHLVVYKAGICD